MTSSKFSNRKRIQQPPPVCKKPYPPIIPLSPGELRIIATWNGVCTDGITRNLVLNVKFNELYPTEGPVYHYESFPNGTAFITTLWGGGGSHVDGQYAWSGDGWYCAGFFSHVIPASGPFSTGPFQANSTGPVEQNSTWKLICG